MVGGDYSTVISGTQLRSEGTVTKEEETELIKAESETNSMKRDYEVERALPCEHRLMVNRERVVDEEAERGTK